MAVFISAVFVALFQTCVCAKTNHPVSTVLLQNGFMYTEHGHHRSDRRLRTEVVAADSTQDGCRVVFSLTTIPSRIDRIKPALDALVLHQTRTPDAVYLSVGPEVHNLPAWLEHYDESSPVKGVLKVLRHHKDAGPGLKLLGGLQQELAEGRKGTVIIYGDDDMVYGPNLLQLHLQQHSCGSSASGQERPKAFGARLIGAGKKNIPVLEATGSISVVASAVPPTVAQIGDAPDACKFSDDYFFAKLFKDAGVEFKVLDDCKMDWNSGSMAPGCLQHQLTSVSMTEPVSKLTLTTAGREKDRASGDWRSQLERYSICEEALPSTT